MCYVYLKQPRYIMYYVYLNNTIYAFLACSFCPIGLPAAIADLKNLEVLNFFNNHIEVSTVLVFILLECIC